MLKSFLTGIKLTWRWLWPALVTTGLLYLFIVAVYNRQTRDYHLKPGLEDSSQFLKGLFGPEKNEQFAYTWTRPVWSIEIPELPQDNYTLRLVLLSLKPQTVTLLDYRWTELQKFTPGGQLQEFTFIIPAQAINRNSLQLNITSPGFEAGDKRLLGVLLTEVDLAQEKKSGIVYPPWWLAGCLAGLGLAVSALLTGLYLLLSGKSKRPLWPYPVGLLTVGAFYLPVLFFPAYSNNFQLHRMLDGPVLGLWTMALLVFFYLGATRLFPAAAGRFFPLAAPVNKPGPLRPDLRRNWALFAALGALALTFLFFAARFEIIPYPFDIDLYWKYGNLILHGAIPFRNFELEYPPFSLFFFILPAAAGNLFEAGLPEHYLVFFQLQFFLITLGLVIVTWKLLGKLYPPGKLNRRMAVLAVSLLLISYYIFGRFDTGPAFLVALALYLVLSDRPALGGAALALGAAAKLYPALLLPLLLIYYWRGRQKRDFALRIGAGFGAAGLVVTLPFAVLGWKGLLDLLQFHSERGLQVESYYASLSWVAGRLGLVEVSRVIDHSSDGISSDWSPALLQLSTYLLAAGILAFYGYFWWAASSRFKARGPAWLIQAAFILIMWFIIANKVLSPQYMIWLLPFAPFIKFNKAWLLWGTLLLSTIAYPFLGKAVQTLETLPMSILLARNIALLALFAWQLRDFVRDKPALF